MRALFGIAELHNIRASAMQAARRAAVSSSCANDAVGSTPTNKPATATIPFRILIITTSHGQALCVIQPVLPMESCDGHHVFGALRARTGIFVTTVTAESLLCSEDGNATEWSTSIKGGHDASCCL
jgi:hypothetical protein